MGLNGFSAIENLDNLTKVGFSDEQARAMIQMMSQDAASRADLERSTTELKQNIEDTRAELKRDIKELDVKIESIKAELKKDIETVRIELKRDIKELESRLSSRMIITSGGFAFAILSAIVTLAKLGLMSP